jgi:hypothetical protein
MWVSLAAGVLSAASNSYQLVRKFSPLRGSRKGGVDFRARVGHRMMEAHGGHRNRAARDPYMSADAISGGPLTRPVGPGLFISPSALFLSSRPKWRDLAPQARFSSSDGRDKKMASFKSLKPDWKDLNAENADKSCLRREIPPLRVGMTNFATPKAPGRRLVRLAHRCCLNWCWRRDKCLAAACWFPKWRAGFW